jgi:hypothetical protein
MPRRKRHETISKYHREAIRRQSGLLLSAIDAAALGLKHFTSQGQALGELRQALIRTENILHGRPADFQLWNSTPEPPGPCPSFPPNDTEASVDAVTFHLRRPTPL